MKSSVKNILSELFEHDPSLKSKEPEIQAYLEMLLKSKPEVQASPELISSLKLKLMNSITPTPAKTSINWKSILTGFLGGGAAVSFAAYGLWNAETLQVNPSPTPTQSTISLVSFAPEKTIQTKEAFGKISLSNTTSAPVGGGRTQDAQNRIQNTPVAQGGNVSSTMALSAQMPEIAPAPTVSARTKPVATSLKIAGNTEATPAMSPAMIDNSKMMIAPDMMPYVPVDYQYIYSGSLGDIPNEMTVYRRLTESMSTTSASEILKRFNLTALDIQRFQDLKIQNIMLAEDKEYGLALSIDFVQGGIYISKNWTKWPQGNCMDETCYEKLRVKLEEVPSDETAVNIANSFTKEYGLDLSKYGTPRVVDNEWKIAALSAARIDGSSMPYISDTVFVLYPEMIDGKEIYEEYGAQKGVRIGIDVRSKKVSDVSGIEKMILEGANYSLEKDEKKLLEIAAKGGRSGYMYPAYINESGVTPKKREVNLGSPTLSYTRIFEYKDNKSNEILVPALIFPVLDTPKDGEWFNTQVVVPLVKDFFEAQNIAVPMPLPAVPMAR